VGEWPDITVCMVNVGPMHEMKKRVWVLFQVLTRTETAVFGLRLLWAAMKWRVKA